VLILSPLFHGYFYLHLFLTLPFHISSIIFISPTVNLGPEASQEHDNKEMPAPASRFSRLGRRIWAAILFSYRIKNQKNKRLKLFN
jgi:hypothetical protein